MPSYPEIPVEAIAVDPAAFAAAMGEAGLVPALDRGAVISQTEARLRHLSAGGLLGLVHRPSVRIAAVVPDTAIGGAEIALSRSRGQAFGLTHTGYLLVPDVNDLAQLSLRVHRIMGGVAVRVRRAGLRPFLRAADDVLPQALVKELFGEYAVERVGGTVAIDRQWVRRMIVTRNVPVLGSVTCNRGVLADLMAVTSELARRGLAHLVDTVDFHRNGGCFNPRTVRGGNGELSRHAWGIAVDINVAANALGGNGHQDPRLVAAFARHHFTWGGHWLRPDPQHFEWVGSVPAYTETATG